MRYLEFLVARIRNRHTRRAYAQAFGNFAAFAEERGIPDLAEVRPGHVGAWIKALGKTHAPQTVKLRLAALRGLLDWLIVGQVIPTNPAASVRGPRHVVRKGRTPVLAAGEAQALIRHIDASTIVGRRDRALIGVMLYAWLCALSREAECICHAYKAVGRDFRHVPVVRRGVAKVTNPDPAPGGGNGVREGEGALAVPGGGVGESAALEQILGPEHDEAVEAQERGRGAVDRLVRPGAGSRRRGGPGPPRR
jgi:site-specific recombinase XerC